jgi:hypothetical protein
MDIGNIGKLAVQRPLLGSIIARSIFISGGCHVGL